MKFSLIIVISIAILSLALSNLSPERLVAQEVKKTNADEFFTDLLVGGAENGEIYLEIPLKSKFFKDANSPKERWAVWDSFFLRVLNEGHNFSGPIRKTYYWGDYTYKKVDWSSVADSIDFHVGDFLQVRTPKSTINAKIVRYEIHHHLPGGSDLLLGVAHPIERIKVEDTDFLIAAPKLPNNGTFCDQQPSEIEADILKKIRNIITSNAKIPPDRKAQKIIARQGRFNKKGTQYIVYAYFGKSGEYDPRGYWRTLFIDSDLSVIKVLGENEYGHIQPQLVCDINGDGLDEVWITIGGYEGHSYGLIYWSNDAKGGTFRFIVNAYDGA